MSTSATAKIAEFENRHVQVEGSSQRSAETTFAPSTRSWGFNDPRLQEITARRAARKNAASVKDGEVQALLAERRELLIKKFDETISRSEERQLNYVRWCLDRIDDARQGEALDQLEMAVARYEGLGREINHLIQRLENYTPKGRKR